MTLAFSGLACALLLGPVVLLAVRRLGGDSLALLPRLALWVLAAWPALQALQRFSGGTPTVQNGQYRQMVALSYGYRAFLVVTAGVTEEILYRGYGIGVGEQLLGGALPALAVSLLVFTIAHSSWGLAHLVSALWAGAVLSMLFVVTRDLLACVLAHVLVDAVGMLRAPMAMARRRQHLERLEKTW